MYYKAEISITTENLWLNPETQEYEGCDPDTFQDHGVVNTIIKSSIEELKKEIEKQFFKIKEQGQLFDGCLEFSYDGEHDYRTPKSEQVPFIETARIYICQVGETIIDSTLVFPELVENK